jgi:hypothetical protein
MFNGLPPYKISHEKLSRIMSPLLHRGIWNVATLLAEHQLKVSEDKLLRKIFLSMKDEFSKPAIYWIE